MRFAHLSPDSPGVDVAMTPVPADGRPLTDPGPDVASRLAYGDVAEYRSLAPGTYAVSVRATGASPATPPALSARIDLPAGSARTVALSGRFADLALAVLPDDHTAPPPASARVRVVAAATRADPVSVGVAAGPVLAEELPFPQGGRYVTVPAGSVELRVTGRPAEVRVDLAAGSVVSLVVLDGPDDGTEVLAVVDATGPASVPTGGVDAGTGPAGVPAAAALAILGAVGLAAHGRTRRLLLVGAATASALVPFVAVPPADAARAAPLPSTAPAEPVPADPVRLRVPAAGVDAALGPVGLDATGELAAPADPARAGWFAAGPPPGRRGPAVVAAHVDWAGRPAAFANLSALRRGDPIDVELADGSVVRFAVTRVEQVAKDAFPTDDVYAPTPDAELRLVTCGGAFDPAAGSYLDNVVVFATAV